MQSRRQANNWQEQVALKLLDDLSFDPDSWERVLGWVKKHAKKGQSYDEILLLARKAQQSAKGFRAKQAFMAPRPACRRCTLKHLGQAAALFQEALQGYPGHRWLAIGHLAEAEAEIEAEDHEIASRLRQMRKQAEDSDYVPEVLEVIVALESKGPCPDCAAMKAALAGADEVKEGEPAPVDEIVAALQALAVEMAAGE